MIITIKKNISSVDKFLKKLKKDPLLNNFNCNNKTITVKDEFDIKTTFPYCEITIDLKDDDYEWEVIGVVKFDENTTKIFGSVREQFKKFNNTIICEHCNSKRRRKIGIEIKNKNTNEIKMVGKTCVQNYVGVCLTSTLNSFENNIFVDDDIENSNVVFVISRNILFDYCIDHYNKKWGYVPTKGYDISTKKMICNNIEDKNYKVQESNKFNEFKNYIENLSHTDFNFNIKSIFEIDNNIELYGNVGIFAYFVWNWLNVKEKQNVQQMEIGKYKNIEVEYIGCKTYDSNYGKVYYYEFKTNDNLFVWKTAKEIEFNSSLFVNFTFKEFRNNKNYVIRLKEVN